MSTLLLLSSCACLFFIYLGRQLALSRTRRCRLPPGPRAWPLIGNLFHLTLHQPWLVFTQWKAIYGDVVHLHGLGNSIVVLNSLRAINELFDQRGAIYCHRPIFTVAGELMGLDQSMPIMAYGDRWKFHRRIARGALSPEACKKHYAMQEDIAGLLNQALIESPNDFFHQIRLAAARIMMSITYGLPVSTADREFIIHAEATNDIITRSTVPGAYLADLFPVFKYLPLWLPFQKDAIVGRRMIEEFVGKPFYHVKRQMEAGTALPSFTHDLLVDPDNDSEGKTRKDFEEVVKWVSGGLYGAGGETTYSTVLTMIAAMMNNPDKQERAHAEIDRVIGTDRLPTIGDRGSLPYVEALIKETMRWHPAAPLGVARRTAQDDVYEGCFIPAGTTVIPNVWLIAQDHNPKYPSESFAPERFLEDNPPIDPNIYVFGFGRRICPGRHLAGNSVFILVAYILATFTISPALDSAGKEVPFEPEFSSGLVSYPQHFQCTIKPRSNARVRQVMDKANNVV